MAVKMHQLLAVHKSQKNQANVCRQELIGTFQSKKHHFEETKKTFKSLEEGVPEKVEDQKDIQTSVRVELKWIGEKLVKMMDVNYQVDLGNTMAKADVIVNDKVFLKDVPATHLMALETELNEIMEIIKVIPTLDPAKGFRPDPNRGKYIYVARTVEKPRTRKDKKVITLAPATEKHPAQAQVVDYDKEIGTIIEQEWSSLISPAVKADMLENVETLTRAVQKARARANDQEIDPLTNKIGKTVWDYIFQPLEAPAKVEDVA